MSSEQFYSAQPDVVDCDIGGDRALLHLQTNTYFTMNATASALWLALAEPKNLDDLVSVVTEKFEVSEDQCRGDIEVLLSQMMEANVIGITPAGVG
ncbi:MAG: PqqD family protein [Paracoccaceae bacterium]|nr:PqqD family protein [Paracoccaceae bacterium]